MRLRFLTFLSLGLLLVAGCADPPRGEPPLPVCGALAWIDGPRSSAPNRFQALFWDCATGSPRGPYLDPGDEVKVSLKMSCCGSSPKPFVQERRDRGVYEVRDLRLVAGTWLVALEVKRGGRIGTKQFEVSVP